MCELAFVASPALLDLFLRHPGRQWFSRSSSRDYVAFVDELVLGGIARVFAVLPVLPRLLDLVTEDSCQRVHLLLKRVESDRALLRERFGLECPVVRIEPLTGGSHTTADGAGARAVYKDRPLGMDVALRTVGSTPAPAFSCSCPT